jgi:hypothetical protein
VEKKVAVNEAKDPVEKVKDRATKFSAL